MRKRSYHQPMAKMRVTLTMVLTTPTLIFGKILINRSGASAASIAQAWVVATMVRTTTASHRILALWVQSLVEIWATGSWRTLATRRVLSRVVGMVSVHPLRSRTKKLPKLG
jgi:uncharacterized PurR-regulated membrane protein YhhQ (DUF165 family)